MGTNSDVFRNGHPAVDVEYRLDLVVTDRDVVEELTRRPDAGERDGYAQSALKVGVLAIRQASGVMDARAIQEECERLIETMRQTLKEHTDLVSDGVSTTLKKYLDPSGGELHLRLDRLIRDGGEFESLLNRHVNGDGSTLSQTLVKHLGPTSPLLRLLSPDQQQGLLVKLKEALQDVVTNHARQLAGQFSLDDKDSALSRLVTAVTEKNGQLRKDLKEDIATIRKEFSLDNPDGALARLVSQFQQANQKILDEFSADNEQSALVRMTALLKSTNDAVAASLTLDDDGSPLARLRRELLNVVLEVKQGNDDFQKKVWGILEAMKARRSEAARSTAHGLDFEADVCSFVEAESRRLNDVFEPTKDSVGVIPRCKVGDCVLTLGAETAAPDSRIVFEAKDDKAYTSKRVREDLQTARENRQAQVGVFVWSRSSAPEITEPLVRHGRDIIVLWDRDDATSDVYLRAAISLARFLVVQEKTSSEHTAADLRAMEAAIEAITRDLALIDQIVSWATTVKNNGEKIGDKASSLKKKIEEQLETLSQHVTGLRNSETS
jgi:hypothetical protein